MVRQKKRTIKDYGSAAKVNIANFGYPVDNWIHYNFLIFLILQVTLTAMDMIFVKLGNCIKKGKYTFFCKVLNFLCLQVLFQWNKVLVLMEGSFLYKDTFINFSLQALYSSEQSLLLSHLTFLSQEFVKREIHLNKKIYIYIYIYTSEN